MPKPHLNTFLNKERPRIFIGSSSEGLDVARAIQAALYYDAEPVVWSQGVFGLSGGTLETLVRTYEEFDFAVLVLTPDDLMIKRGTRVNAARDNVLFELGLFMGQLGRERTFFVHCVSDNISIPSDLAGITAATYIAPSAPQFLHAAVSGASTPILAAIRTLGKRSRSASPGTATRSEVDDLRSQVQEMRVLIGSLSAVAQSNVNNEVKNENEPHFDVDWSFLAGTWRGIPTHSTAWIAIVDGQPRFLYCYMGSGEPTGEYYDFVRTGDTVTGKFRWFDVPDTWGYAWFAIRESKLDGGWWMHRDVPQGHEKKLPHVPGMVPLKWIRESTRVPPKMQKRLQLTNRVGPARPLRIRS